MVPQGGVAMNQFEFVFSLFGLLLGFSLVEVLGGLAKAVEANVRPAAGGSKPVQIGWLTPLLAVYVMLDLVSYWGGVWTARDALTMNGRVLLGGLAFAGSYYLAAHLVFPPDLSAERDLDAHYFRVRRIVLGTLTALLALQLAFWLSVPSLAANFRNPALIAKTALAFGLVAAAMLVRGRRASVAILSMMIALYLHDYIMAA